MAGRHLVWQGKGVKCQHFTGAGLLDMLSRQHAGAPGAPAFLIAGLTSGDDSGGLDGEIYPTLAHLPGANEDARAGGGSAIPVNVKLGDVAVARFRGRKAAEDGKVLAEADARAARGRAEDQDVRGRSGGDTELEINRTAGVGDNEIAHGAGVETGALGWGEDRRLALKSERGIDFHEDQVRGEARRLTETGPAVGSTDIGRPRGALGIGECAPQGPDAAKDCAVEELGGAGALADDATSAADLAIARTDADEVCASARLGYVLYLHVCCRGGGVPGPVRVSAQVTGNCRNNRADPLA